MNQVPVLNRHRRCYSRWTNWTRESADSKRQFRCSSLFCYSLKVWIRPVELSAFVFIVMLLDLFMLKHVCIAGDDPCFLSTGYGWTHSCQENVFPEIICGCKPMWFTLDWTYSLGVRPQADLQCNESSGLTPQTDRCGAICLISCCE